MSIAIDHIKLHFLKMDLKSPFTTSFGTFKDKEFFITEVVTRDGVRGFGESVAFTIPWYNEESVKTNVHMINDYLIPILKRNKINHPEEVSELFAPIRRNNMAKSALEGAIWDVYAKQEGMTLAQALGGRKDRVEVGVSIGIKDSVKTLLKDIEQGLEKGFKRIKVKIKPGWDVEVLREIRAHFPDIKLMADANSAYSLQDLEHLKKLDEFDLMMIEQPLAHDDIIDHASLQKEIETPICLDESIHSLEDTRKAIELGSCGIINIKIGRVGGLTESKRIHDYCKEHDIPVWCGGMLEAGVGRAHNVALASLSQFTLPGDTAGSSHYWEEDIINPEVVAKNGEIVVPDRPGIGYDIDETRLEKYKLETKKYTF